MYLTDKDHFIEVRGVLQRDNLKPVSACQLHLLKEENKPNMRQMRTALLCVIIQRIVVISYRRFGTTYRSYLQGSRIQNIKHNEEASLESVKVERWVFYGGLIQITVILSSVYLTSLLYIACVYVLQRSVYGLVEDGRLKRLCLTNTLTRRPNWEADLISYWNDL